MAYRNIAGTVDGANVITAGGAEVDPISRIEGHLGVKLVAPAGVVTEANIHGNLWRGFENFLLGRSANDAITFTQRICGVCPVPHGQTSTYAVDAAFGYNDNHITFVTAGTKGVPAKAVHIRNLVLSAEFLMSHITHFYHLVALDYVQGPAMPPWTPWFDNSYYHALLLNPGGTTLLPAYDDGFSANIWEAAVTQYVKALRIRRLTFEAGALFAGRMPMTSCFVGGGVTNDSTEDLSDRCDKYEEIMTEVGEFILKEHVPLVLALGALYPNYDNFANASLLNTAYPALWTMGNFSDTATPTDGVNTNWGAGCGNFLAWGAFPIPQTISDLSTLPFGVKDALGIGGGVFKGGKAGAILFQAPDKAGVAATFTQAGGANSVPVNLKESIAYSRYTISEFDTANIDATTKLGYPGAVQRTKPDRSNGYSYIKAPRWDGDPCEVGPFARMVVNGYITVDETDGIVDTFPTAAALYGKGAGLDPAMVSADLAVACLRDGIATLTVGATVVGDPTGVDGGTVTLDVGTLSNAQIVAAYTDPAAEITGAVAAWVLGIVGGLSVMDRLRGRALEAALLIQQMIGLYNKTTGQFSGGWIADLRDNVAVDAPTFTTTPPATNQTGRWGGTEAPRGALMHFISTNAQNKITAYQCVVPTTWNASPHDAAGNRGPIEEAMIGVPYEDVTQDFGAAGGLEALRVAHTFDPCIACAVH